MSPQPKLYGVVSGDLTNSGSYGDLGLAPRHTLFAYQALLGGGLVFPYQFAPHAAARPVDPLHAQRVLDFFAQVNADPAMIALAVAADSIVAHSRADSIGGFPINAIDADGVPKPLTASVALEARTGDHLLGTPSPNPFFAEMRVGFATPRDGAVSLKVYDLEGRHVATLVDRSVAAGVHEAAWNGRAGNGGRVPAGIYLIRFAGFGHSETQRIALMR